MGYGHELKCPNQLMTNRDSRTQQRQNIIVKKYTHYSWDAKRI